jgi:hypothetical protein
MQLYVCYGTFKAHHDHPCRTAHQALTAAGHRPKVVRTGGCYGSDPLWPRRRKVRRLTGNYKVPTLCLDDGTIIDGSENIVAWATEQPSTPATVAAEVESERRV